MKDWMDWYFEIWEPEHPGEVASWQDYLDYLWDVADLALGDL